MWIGALLRRVSAAGDFAAVLHRGDDIAGSVVLIHRTRATQRALTRGVGPDGATVWHVAMSGESLDDWIERQRRYDPDLWVIELDTPDLARFVDEPIV